MIDEIRGSGVNTVTITPKSAAGSRRQTPDERDVAVRCVVIKECILPHPTHVIPLSGAADMVARKVLGLSNHLVEAMGRDDLCSVSSLMLGMRQQEVRMTLDKYPHDEDTLRRQTRFLLRRCMRMLARQHTWEDACTPVLAAG